MTVGVGWAPPLSRGDTPRDGGTGTGWIAEEACRACGACCAFSADWPRFSLEDDAALGRIPRELVADDESGMRCTGDRCAALAGDVGRDTSCAIYADRPEVCRACAPGDEACRMARRRHGL